MSEDRKSRVGRILSESFLVKGDVDKAKEYYQESLDGEKQTRSDYFRAGEIAYLSSDWQGTVENFGKMGDKADSLGQIANYQSAFSYIQLHNKVAAMEAFKEASAQHFQADIQEDAFYNYAKLAFDLGKDTQPFAQYLKRYNKRNDAIYSYMAMAALVSHDYEAAVDAYDHIDELDSRMKSNYMKAYFLRARELMEAGSWRLAAPLLKSASYYSPKRDGFNQLCRYYLAECLYRDGRWAEARAELQDLNNLQALYRRPEGNLIPYQLAYTYFKEANYEQALKWFKQYNQSGNPQMGADALTRVADCYFFAADYQTALDAYEKQLSQYPERGNLYPRYRAGVASGLLDRNRRKISILEPALETSAQTPYYGECLYELGRAYVAVKEVESAVSTFKTLHSRTQDPSLKDRSLLELGMIERNAGHSAQALDYYKQVVSRGGEFREDALLAIEAIYRTRETTPRPPPPYRHIWSVIRKPLMLQRPFSTWPNATAKPATRSRPWTTTRRPARPGWKARWQNRPCCTLPRSIMRQADTMPLTPPTTSCGKAPGWTPTVTPPWWARCEAPTAPACGMTPSWMPERC